MSPSSWLEAVADRPPGRPLIIAHRGASAVAPENTLEAAQLGWEAGAEAWELDVQLTRDGVPIVLHDATLARTTDVARRFASDSRTLAGYRVADFDAAEVATLDAGSWFLDETTPPRHRSARDFGTVGRVEPSRRVQYTSGAVTVPSLRACLERTAELRWLVNVELKASPENSGLLLEQVAAEVERLGLAPRVLISSFDHRVVARAGQVALAWATGILTTHPLHQPDRYARSIVGAQFYHPAVTAALGIEHDDPPELAVPWLVYTVNDARPGGLADQLARLGVAGLFTDDPEPLRQRYHPVLTPG